MAKDVFAKVLLPELDLLEAGAVAAVGEAWGMEKSPFTVSPGFLQRKQQLLQGCRAGSACGEAEAAVVAEVSAYLERAGERYVDTVAMLLLHRLSKRLPIMLR